LKDLVDGVSKEIRSYNDPTLIDEKMTYLGQNECMQMIKDEDKDDSETYSAKEIMRIISKLTPLMKPKITREEFTKKLL
jgi:hypothetical protein